jgi:hypothetical protein
MIPPGPAPSLQDADPLDARLERASGVAPARGRLGPALAAPHTRTLILLPLGVALGPSGVNLLSAPVLAFVDPLVSVGLAVLGILLGMALDVRRPGVAVAGGAAMLEASVTVLLVGSGALALHTVWLNPGAAPWLFALLLGICAAASFAPATAGGEPHSLRLAHPGDLNSILTVTAGAFVLALHRAGTVAGAALFVGGVSLVALALAAAGWLLVTHPASDRERHTFVAGTLLLLGGAAAYLGHSALFVGLLAGLFWGEAGGAAGDRIARDLRYVQHPLIVLLLLVTGARLGIGTEALALAAVYLLCRNAGKLVGARLVSRQVPRGPFTSEQLLAPGIVGLALALDVLQAGGDHGRTGLLLSAVAIGGLATDLMSVTAFRHGVRP